MSVLVFCYHLVLPCRNLARRTNQRLIALSTLINIAYIHDASVEKSAFSIIWIVVTYTTGDTKQTTGVIVILFLPPPSVPPSRPDSPEGAVPLGGRSPEPPPMPTRLPGRCFIHILVPFGVVISLQNSVSEPPANLQPAPEGWRRHGLSNVLPRGTHNSAELGCSDSTRGTK
jgi:hypothetical protein